ncbi:MAG: cell division protein FtsZ [Candidatus Jacksonbacteria bacterium]|jgi:cell division protein FtsZ|nr:cell division protein FtsZ [Candidatus Jacksonbacteria bacterium]MBT6034755.1 cell division protein FtsZ [Candidatus Jacksonbacteria bacterium]MBT6301193.1 cell division protein FtsZ [Candidatus Jacksonbacteria bacterium]MBT6757060.1 cell division protein FtsZ [Candidatus Jacksonbacteria bacterium]MBT6954796.1 cell division protein FtsZ [Candidatus Jacksonbacteria bacterium]
MAQEKTSAEKNSKKVAHVTEVTPDIETFAKIKVIGVGGSGNAAITRMMEVGIRGVEFLGVNTDAQAIHHCKAPSKIQIGKSVTRGLGAGMDPEQGKRAAEETTEEIEQRLSGADMVFITCGLGGGTGTGASPIIARIARDLGALTVAVVTKPFNFEGAQRKAISERGFEALADQVDTIISIPNDRLLHIIDKKTTLLDAFEVVDDVLRQGVQGISELITVPGLINVDFADVKSIMQNAGSALMGIGRGEGDNRAAEAAKAAIDSPLLEVSIDGAKGILFTVAGDQSLGMYEVNEAAQIITKQADPGARVIFGTVIDETLGDEIKITVVATGFSDEALELVSREKAEQSQQEEQSTEEKKPEEKKKESSIFHDRTEEKKKKEEPAVMSSQSSENNSSAPTLPEEDELEIPAFIRKKMG